VIFDTKAPQGGLVFAGGSVDQKNTYVFEVLPSGFSESSAKTISNWSTGNGDDTMVTMWNPADEAQDFTFTLFYAGGQYLHPIHLEPRATQVFNVSELTHNATPDAAGSVVPAGIYQGSAEISGTQSEQEHILVAMDVGIYNVQKATCNGICPTCMGFTTGSIAVDPFAVPIGGQTQETLYMQMGSGGQNTVPATNWASTNTGMATVSSGMVTGVGVGSPTISSNSQFQEAVFVPFDCNSFCPTGFVEGSTPGSVTPPPTVTFSPIAGVSVGGTATTIATVSPTTNTVPISLSIAPGNAVVTIPSGTFTANQTSITIKGVTPGTATLTASPCGGSPPSCSTTFPVLSITQNKNLWFFGTGMQTPSGFTLGSTSATLTVNGGVAGTYAWTAQGTNDKGLNELAFENGSTSITKTTNTVPVFASSYSTALNQVTLQLTYTPSGGSPVLLTYKLTIDYPYKLTLTPPAPPFGVSSCNKPLQAGSKGWGQTLITPSTKLVTLFN
jgi:hypothetical protein